MPPFLPVAQISPGVGVMEGLLLVFFLIALFCLLLVSAIVCGMQTWRLSRFGNPKKGLWLAATIVSCVLLMSLTGGCLWVVTPKPLPQFEKHWDFTHSHSIEVIGEHGEQDNIAYTGKIAVQILLPDQRSLTVQAQNLIVKCEQGQVKEIQVLIPGLKDTEQVRKQGETILHSLRSAPALVDQWRTGFPGFGWTVIQDDKPEPKIYLDGHHDDVSDDTTLNLWITWKD